MLRLLLRLRLRERLLLAPEERGAQDCVCDGLLLLKCRADALHAFWAVFQRGLLCLCTAWLGVRGVEGCGRKGGVKFVLSCEVARVRACAHSSDDGR